MALTSRTADADLAARGMLRLSQKASLAVLFMAGYIVLDAISFIHPLQSLNITPWSPQRALLIALILVYGAGWIVWVYLTVLVSEVAVVGMHLPPGHAVTLAAVLTCAYATIAYVIRDPLQVRLDLPTRRDVLRLAIAIVAGSGITGALYVGVLFLVGGIETPSAVSAIFRFWIGDCIGMLVTLPFLLLLASAHRLRELVVLIRKRELLLEVGVLIAAMLFVLTRPELEQSRFFYILFLPLIWIAARHGLVGAILAIMVVQTGIIAATMLSGHQAPTMVELQTLLLAYVLTGLLLGATVDELRSASQRLARSLQVTIAGEMATALAHELGQPLTALTNYADAIGELAKVSDPNGRALTQAAEAIRRVATRSAETVRKFRTLAAPANHATQPLDLRDCIAAAVADIEERARETRIAVRVAVAADIPPLRFDGERMRFVLRNLLANALDAIADPTHTDGSIDVIARLEGRRELAIIVINSGPGIGTDIAEKIFEPFYSGKAQGMGLGLAVSRSIVESHGGRIWAEPSDRGIFHVRLPV